MSSSEATLSRIKQIKRHTCVFKDDKNFLIFEIEKRNRVIKILGDAIKGKLTQRFQDQAIAKAKAEFEKTVTPEYENAEPAQNVIRVDFYVHSSKESLWEIGEKIGLKDEALRLFSYTGCEMQVTVDVAVATGESKLISVSDGKDKALT